jgi:hypothetical protein
MARDFGGGRPRWRRGERLGFLRDRLGAILLVAGFLVFASLPTAFALSGSFHDDTGPVKASGGRPCRVISRAEFERGWREPPHSFNFAGATFERRRGDVECSARQPGGLGKPYVACAFDAPYQVAVAAMGRQGWFEVGAGNMAVVEARIEGLRCTVTGRYMP